MGDDIQDQSSSGVRKRGSRGVGFPAVSLPDAAEIMKRAGMHGRQHSIDAMASYSGHATANSGPFRQKLAALRDWGFVTTTAHAVTITDAGMEVALPSSPQSALHMLADAFRQCDIFWRIYSEGAKDTPLYPGSIANVAVTAHGISGAARDKFVVSFIDSAVMVGLAQKLPNGEIKLLPAMSPALSAQSVPKEPVRRDSNVERIGLKDGIRQVWRHNDIEITLEVSSPRPLSATAFMQVGEVVTAIETLREIVTDS